MTVTAADVVEKQQDVNGLRSDLDKLIGSAKDIEARWPGYLATLDFPPATKDVIVGIRATVGTELETLQAILDNTPT